MLDSNIGRKLAIVNELFYVVFLQSFQANVWLVFRLGHNCFLSESPFINHSTIRHYII
jgi:hypothetical protein